jgi:hypothetical protein
LAIWDVVVVKPCDFADLADPVLKSYRHVLEKDN